MHTFVYGPYQWDNNGPMFNPLAGNETNSLIFLFRAASKRFRCKQSTLGKVENVCCFFVGVFLLQPGQWTGSASFSGIVKCSKQLFTLIFKAVPFEALLSRDSRSTSSVSVSDMLTNGSWSTLLRPHSRHKSTDLKVPSNSCLTTSCTKEQLV